MRNNETGSLKWSNEQTSWMGAQLLIVRQIPRQFNTQERIHKENNVLILETVRILFLARYRMF